MQKLLVYLRSSRFALLVAIVSMLVQTPHSFTAFYNTSAIRDSWGIAQALTFAIVIDLAIIFYTLRKRTDIAVGAALVMFIINAYYYWSAWGISWSFGFGCFLAGIIPISVYFYSEEIEEEGAPDERDEQLRVLWRDQNDLIGRKTDLELTNAKFLARIQDLEGDNRVKGEQINKLNGVIALLTKDSVEPVDEKTRARVRVSDLPADNHVQDASKVLTFPPTRTGGTSVEETDPDR